MRNFILIACFIFGAVFFNKAEAQKISENAIGLRLGGSNGFGAEASYQRAIGGDNNRLELDLGFRNDNTFDAFKLTGLYQWVWNIEGGFNWYVGAGAGLGSVDLSDEGRRQYGDNDGTFIFLAGNIGIEYDFDIPLILSLDLRPEFGFTDYDAIDDITPDIALGLRYQF